jgi:ligand-binding sensor domain-containing protein
MPTVHATGYTVLLIIACSLPLASCDSEAATGDGGGIHYDSESGLARELVHAAAACPNGSVWFGYGLNGGGLTRISDSEARTFTTDDGLERDHVHALACDSSSRVWIGYGVNAGGLTRYDGSSWHTYTTADGLASDYVEDVAAATNGRVLVVYGNNGQGADLFVP